MKKFFETIVLSDIDGVFNSGEVFLDYSLRHYTPHTGDIQRMFQDLEKKGIDLVFISSSKNGKATNKKYLERYFPEKRALFNYPEQGVFWTPENRAGIIIDLLNISKNVVYVDDSVVSLTILHRLLKDEPRIKLHKVDPSSFFALVYDMWRKKCLK